MRGLILVPNKEQRRRGEAKGQIMLAGSRIDLEVNMASAYSLSPFTCVCSLPSPPPLLPLSLPYLPCPFPSPLPRLQLLSSPLSSIHDTLHITNPTSRALLSYAPILLSTPSPPPSAHPSPRSTCRTRPALGQRRSPHALRVSCQDEDPCVRVRR